MQCPKCRNVALFVVDQGWWTCQSCGHYLARAKKACATKAKPK
jgi:ribosomal protein L37AE/L43A